MKIRILFLLVLNLLSHECLASKTSVELLKTITEPIKEIQKKAIEKVLPFATHGLQIFLDDSETKIGEYDGAISIKLLTALYQKAAPILASASLLSNIFIRYGNLQQLAKREVRDQRSYQAWSDYFDVVRETLQKAIQPGKVLDSKGIVEIVQTVNKALPTRPSWDGYKLWAGILEEIVDFNPVEWKIYWSGDNHLALLIPKNYAPAFTLLAAQEKDPIANELLSGFKLNSLTLSKNFLNELEIVQQPKDKNYFTKALSQIFTDGSEYRKRGFSLDNMPRWAIYLSGHGLADTQSAGIPLDQFKIALDFAQHKLVTRLFAYSTCYAAGTNLEKIYKIESGRYKTYSFAIAMEGIIETPSHVLNTDFYSSTIKQDNIDFEKKKLRLHSPYRFDEFFKKMAQTDIIDFAQTLELVFPQTKDIDLIRQLKLPGIESFNIIDTDRITISIGSVLAKTRDTPLSIMDFAKKRNKNAAPKYILLYTAMIPFELVIDTPEIPQFVSMFPGIAIHKFSAIRSLKFNIFELSDAFLLKIFGLTEHYIKYFMIDRMFAKAAQAEIEIKSGEYAKKTINEVENVLITQAKNAKSVFLEFERSEYTLNRDRLTKSDYKKKLTIDASNFEREKENIKKIGEVQIKKAQEIKKAQKGDNKLKAKK